MKMRKLAAAMALLSFAAQAQTVPAIQPMPLVMAVDPSEVGDQPMTITKQERDALNIAGKWIKHTARPTPSGDGSVQYVFGASAPTLICAKLQMCAVRFQAGEALNSIKIGDSARWKLGRSVFGDNGSEIEVVMVKPMVSGSVTNMIVTTNRRIYTILLKAAKHEWMPFIDFHYPEDDLKAMEQQMAQRQKAVYSSTLSNGMNIGNLDFGFKISGDNPSWKPIRVYTNGKKTFIEFESISNDAPAFVALEKEGNLFSDLETVNVNYRPFGNGYLVDGTPKLFALISGVGNNQKKVIVEKVGGPK